MRGTWEKGFRGKAPPPPPPHRAFGSVIVVVACVCCTLCCAPCSIRGLGSCTGPYRGIGRGGAACHAHPREEAHKVVHLVSQGGGRGVVGHRSPHLLRDVRQSRGSGLLHGQHEVGPAYSGDEGLCRCMCARVSVGSGSWEGLPTVAPRCKNQSTTHVVQNLWSTHNSTAKGHDLVVCQPTCNKRFRTPATDLLYMPRSHILPSLKRRAVWCVDINGKVPTPSRPPNARMKAGHYCNNRGNNWHPRTAHSCSCPTQGTASAGTRTRCLL